VQTPYAASYGLHLVVRKERGDAPKVMPLEALWWVDEAKQRDVLAAVALRRATMADSDRDRWRWRWRAMIMQPDPIDPAAVARAVEQVRRQQPPPALDRLRFERWTEGRCAQTLRVGSYADEGPTIVHDRSARTHGAGGPADRRGRRRHGPHSD
jgi:hypothetical protein